MKTKVAMLQNQHLEMGDHYVHKDHKDAVFRFMSIDAEKATFVSAPLFGPETTVTVELGMLKQWKAFKGELPVVGCAKLTTLFCLSTSRASKMSSTGARFMIVWYLLT